MSFQTLVPGQIWYARQPLKFGPLNLTTRATFVRLANGEVWAHSPILPTPELLGAIAKIGPVKYVIAPNKSHHLFFLAFLQACRDAEGYIAPGLADKRPDLAGFPTIPSVEGTPWITELDSLFIEGLPVINETVWFHNQSGTLILTDLLFCFGQDHALLARLAARLLGVYGRLGMSRSMKLLIQDRTALSRCAQRILDWDVRRIVVAHGEIIEANAKQRLVEAFKHLI